jgi:2-polyprenyl-3-methyl-5-hydroxy-6-metoxy-1,4-benzoquinol methylase
VTSCCDPRGYDRMFDARFARRMASRYRKRGLSRTAQAMVDLLPADSVQGATVLEIGGGVGEIQVELLRRGAARATNLELSSSYDAEAGRLLTEHGLTGRVARRMVDIVAEPAAVQSADIVVLHRVVCCYPDAAALLSAAADHARRHLVFSYPPRNPVSRAVVATQNFFLRLGKRSFRTFAHSPEAMLGVLSEHGLHTDAAPAGRFWQVAALSR